MAEEGKEVVDSEAHKAYLAELFRAKYQEITSLTNSDFREFQIPLARVKKIMKSDEEVRMISAETPALFSKACEFFIIELTYRAWIITDKRKHRTLQRSDVEETISSHDFYDFLLDTIGQEFQPTI